MRKPSFALTAIFLLATLLAAQAWQGPETVAVQVNDAKGHPVSGARIILTFVGIPGQTGPPYVETNDKGRAVLANLAPGAWQFEVLHPDYLSFVAMVDIRRGKKPLVSASFLEAGGTSLTPVRVKFSKGNPADASPFLQEARQPPPPPPSPPAADVETTLVQETTQPEVTPPPAPTPTPTRETSPPPPAPAVESTAPEPAPRPVEPEPTRSIPPLAVAAVPSSEEATSETDSADTGEPTPESARPEPSETVSQPAPEPVVPKAPVPEPEAQPEPVQEAEASPAPAVVAAPPTEEPEIEPEPAAVDTPTPAEPVEELVEPTPDPQPPTPPVEEKPDRSVPPLPVPVAPGTEEASAPQETLPEVVREEAAAQPTEIVTPEPAPSAPEAPPPLPVSPAGGVAAAPAPSGPSITSFREGTCADCEAGQWSATASSVIGAAPDGSAGCPAGVVDAVRPAAQGLSNSINLELAGYLGPIASEGAQDAIRLAESDLSEPFSDSLSTYVDGSSSCQVVALVLPKVLRIGSVRYFASDQGGRDECSPGEMCSIADARWLGSARVERGPSSTVIFAVFENRSQDRQRRAEMAVIFRAPNATWKPRTTVD